MANYLDLISAYFSIFRNLTVTVTAYIIEMKNSKFANI